MVQHTSHKKRREKDPVESVSCSLLFLGRIGICPKKCCNDYKLVNNYHSIITGISSFDISPSISIFSYTFLS